MPSPAAGSPLPAAGAAAVASAGAADAALELVSAWPKPEAASPNEKRSEKENLTN